MKKELSIGTSNLITSWLEVQIKLKIPSTLLISVLLNATRVLMESTSHSEMGRILQELLGMLLLILILDMNNLEEMIWKLLVMLFFTS